MPFTEHFKNVLHRELEGNPRVDFLVFLCCHSFPKPAPPLALTLIFPWVLIKMKFVNLHVSANSSCVSSLQKFIYSCQSTSIFRNLFKIQLNYFCQCSVFHVSKCLFLIYFRVFCLNLESFVSLFTFLTVNCLPCRFSFWWIWEQLWICRFLSLCCYFVREGERLCPVLYILKVQLILSFQHIENAKEKGIEFLYTTHPLITYGFPYY